MSRNRHEAGAIEASTVHRAVLAALLATVLPPRAGVPGGGDDLIVASVLADAEAGVAGTALDEVLGRLPAEFATGSADDRERAFSAVEAEDPVSAAAVVGLAYTAYYTDSRVLEALEREHGYNAGPPQPAGYDLPTFPVERLWRTDADHRPLWRKP